MPQQTQLYAVLASHVWQHYITGLLDGDPRRTSTRLICPSANSSGDLVFDKTMAFDLTCFSNFQASNISATCSSLGASLVTIFRSFAQSGQNHVTASKIRQKPIFAFMFVLRRSGIAPVSSKRRFDFADMIPMASSLASGRSQPP